MKFLIAVFLLQGVLTHFLANSEPLFFRGKLWNGFLGGKNEFDLHQDNGVKTAWFEQRLDNFDTLNTQTWKQRYFVNDQFYKPGGPAFIQIGGEGEANIKWMTSGHWTVLAKDMNAMCFMLEHRYYGQSHPTSNMTTANLKYLSSNQALADLANFITAMKVNYKLKDAKWVTFGGSYPGSLSAWFRLKYPHLAHAAVSSSAPLLAVMDFVEYLGVVRDSLNSVSSGCNKQIALATAQLTDMVSKGVNLDAIKKMFMLCDSINHTNTLDVKNLFSTLAGNFMGIVQYNRDNRDGNNVTMDMLCQQMTSSSNPVEGLAAVNKMVLESTKTKCLDFTYASLMALLNATNWNSSAAAGGRQWTYQTCTEFGFFQTSDLPNQPFGHSFPLSLSLQQCIDAFGPEFNQNNLSKGINMTNIRYGAKDIATSKVIFVNGSVDPWHKLGLTSGPVGDNTIIYIEGTAHCANMYPASAHDIPQLTEARIAIASALKSYLAS